MYLVFPQRDHSWGYLSQGLEGIGGKELWLCLPEVHELRHGGENDCGPRLSPSVARLPASAVKLHRLAAGSG